MNGRASICNHEWANTRYAEFCQLGLGNYELLDKPIARKCEACGTTQRKLHNIKTHEDRWPDDQ